MIILESKDDCCGCGACRIKCPKHAITMVCDKSGFNYPEINLDLCINCNLCKQVCPMLNIKDEHNIKKIFALKNKNDDIRERSSSGGFFFELAKNTINNNGVVYGAVFNDLEVKHMRIEELIHINKFSKSKYIQSELGEIFNEVKNDLNNNKLVLFSGTPCQIRALKLYLDKDYDTLITCDLICHGVGSPNLFKDHVRNVEHKRKKKVISYDFRFKNRYSLVNTKIVFSDNSELIIENDKFYELFSSYNRRVSCFKCPFTINNRPGDLTIGDFQDHKKILKGFNDRKGISLLILNSSRGETAFTQISDCFIKKECNESECMQPSLKKREEIDYKVHGFWNDYINHDYEYVCSKYIRNRLYKIIKKYMRHFYINVKRMRGSF